MDEHIRSCLDTYWPQIQTLVGIPPNSPPPQICFDQLADWSNSPCYDPLDGIVKLRTPWRASDLIHESVHHAQNLQKPLGIPPYKNTTHFKHIIAHLNDPHERQARHITRQLLGYQYLFGEEIKEWAILMITSLTTVLSQMKDTLLYSMKNGKRKRNT